ncbi:MAG: hypothetical protein WCX31_14360 [Salinivirgaceae bacterium]|jgi:hypothetical protein
MQNSTNNPGISFQSHRKDNKKQGIKHLKALYLAENKRKYPSIPDYARSFPDYSDKTANGLTKCIIDFIKLSGYQAERINCMGRIIDNRETVSDVMGNIRTIGRVQYGKTTGQRGTADISATIKGRSVKIEVKIGRDRQSQAQKDYQKLVENSGGVYFIATDFEQFYNWFILTFGSHE